MLRGAPWLTGSILDARLGSDRRGKRFRGNPKFGKIGKMAVLAILVVVVVVLAAATGWLAPTMAASPDVSSAALWRDSTQPGVALGGRAQQNASLANSTGHNLHAACDFVHMLHASSPHTRNAMMNIDPGDPHLSRSRPHPLSRLNALRSLYTHSNMGSPMFGSALAGIHDTAGEEENADTPRLDGRQGKGQAEGHGRASTGHPWQDLRDVDWGVAELDQQRQAQAALGRNCGSVPPVGAHHERAGGRQPHGREGWRLKGAHPRGGQRVREAAAACWDRELRASWLLLCCALVLAAAMRHAVYTHSVELLRRKPVQWWAAAPGYVGGVGSTEVVACRHVALAHVPMRPSGARTCTTENKSRANGTELTVSPEQNGTERHNSLIRKAHRRTRHPVAALPARSLVT